MLARATPSTRIPGPLGAARSGAAIDQGADTRRCRTAILGLFEDLERDAKKLDNVSVEVSTTDSVDSVARKLKAGIKRKTALEPGASGIRDLAKDLIREARK